MDLLILNYLEEGQKLIIHTHTHTHARPYFYGFAGGYVYRLAGGSSPPYECEWVNQYHCMCVYHNQRGFTKFSQLNFIVTEPVNDLFKVVKIVHHTTVRQPITTSLAEGRWLPWPRALHNGELWLTTLQVILFYTFF